MNKNKIIETPVISMCESVSTKMVLFELNVLLVRFNLAHSIYQYSGRGYEAFWTNLYLVLSSLFPSLFWKL